MRRRALLLVLRCGGGGADVGGGWRMDVVQLCVGGWSGALGAVVVQVAALS